MAASPQRTPRLAPEARRAQLLDAALELVVEEGFAALNVEAVARRAGVTRPVVYDLLGDLDGLLLALIDREEQAALGTLLDIVEGDPGEVDPAEFFERAVLTFLRAVRDHPRTWTFVLSPPEGGSGELQARVDRSRALVAARVTELIDWAFARRGGPEGLDHPLLARLLVAAAEDGARLTLAHPRRYPPEALAAHARGLLALLPTSAPPDGPAPVPYTAPPPPAPAPRPAPAAAGGRLPRAQRREQLLDVALEHLAEEGFSTLSVEAIARRAGVNRVVVYRSFANLGVLLVALLAREDARTRKQLDPLLPSAVDRHPGELLDTALVGFLEAVARSPRTWRLALQRPESAPAVLRKLVARRRTEIAKRLRPLVAAALGRLPPGAEALDADVVARLLFSVAEQLGRLSLEEPEEFGPQRIVPSARDLFVLIPWHSS